MISYTRDENLGQGQGVNWKGFYSFTLSFSVLCQTLRDLMDDKEMHELDKKPKAPSQQRILTEADKKRRKLEEDMRKEKEERKKKRQELLKKEDEYEKV